MGPSYFNTVDRLPNNLRNYIGGTNAGYSAGQQQQQSFSGYRPFTPWGRSMVGGAGAGNPFMQQSPFQFMPTIGRNWMMPAMNYNATAQDAAAIPPDDALMIPPVGGNPHLAPKPPKPTRNFRKLRKALGGHPVFGDIFDR